MAQELEKIVPNATFTNPSTGHMGIIYEKLVPYLVEGIKTQHAQLGKQQAELSKLEDGLMRQRKEQDRQDVIIIQLIEKIQMLEREVQLNKDHK